MKAISLKNLQSLFLEFFMRLTSIGKRLAIGSLAIATAALAIMIPATPAAAAVAGREVVTVSTGRTSNNKSITAHCDVGQRVIGAAAWMVNAVGEVRITDMIPRTDYVYVYAREDEDGTSASWDLYASAICADEIPGMVIVERTSTTTSNQYNSVAADCTGGNVLLGTGYRINNGLGQVGIDDLTVTSSTRLSAWAYEDGSGFSGTWSLTGFAVCAPPPAGLVIVSKVGADHSDYVRSLTAKCPEGKEILGGGGQVDGGAGQVIIEDLYIHNDDEYMVTAFEDDDGTSSFWHEHVYAICADE